MKKGKNTSEKTLDKSTAKKISKNGIKIKGVGTNGNGAFKTEVKEQPPPSATSKKKPDGRIFFDNDIAFQVDAEGVKTRLDDEIPLKNLQGNILKGHGRPNMELLFIKFDLRSEETIRTTKGMISNLAKGLTDEPEFIEMAELKALRSVMSDEEFDAFKVTSAESQRKQTAEYKKKLAAHIDNEKTEKLPNLAGNFFVGLMLSSNGYRALKFSEENIPQDPRFRLGMKHETVMSKLGDPPLGQWEQEYQNEIHAVLLLAHSDKTKIQAVALVVEKIVNKYGIVVKKESGRAIPFSNNPNESRVKEHFGFVDGISQPYFLNGDIEGMDVTRGSDDFPDTPESALRQPHLDPNVNYRDEVDRLLSQISFQDSTKGIKSAIVAYCKEPDFKGFGPLSDLLDNESANSIAMKNSQQILELKVLLRKLSWYQKNSGLHNWSPAASLSMVLAQEPGSEGLGKRFGSYFVYRKLEQDVKKFEDMAKKLRLLRGFPAGDKNAQDEALEESKARIMGRNTDGCPLGMEEMRADIKKRAQENSKISGYPLYPNNYNYSHDPSGSKCPFHSHVRLANPREAGYGGPNPNLGMIVRRGMTYGEEKAESGKGLLFLCCQADIESQFEHLQVRLADKTVESSNGYAVPGVAAGAYGSPGANDDLPAPFNIFKAVSLKGGEYFFAPSIPFLESLKPAAHITSTFDH